MNYIYRIFAICSMGGVGGARSGSQLSPDSLAHLMLNTPGHVGVRCKNTAMSPAVMVSSYLYSIPGMTLRNYYLIISVLIIIICMIVLEANAN